MTLVYAAARILALSSFCNSQSIAAFSSPSFRSKAAYRSHRRTIFGNHKNFSRRTHDIMSSTSSSPLPGDSGEVPTPRRSLRKRGSGRSSSAAASSTSSSSRSSVSPKNENGVELLERWIQHDHHSYHLDFLSPAKAFEIRIALVDWYRANRRKLPWRGDAGPYDGSTAGFGAVASAAAAAGGKANGKKRKDEGKDIRSFFATPSSKKGKKSVQKKTPRKKSADELQHQKSDGEDVVSDGPREITAYGVWVSEIMLQQTRVEAVIPYYLKWMQSFPTVHCLAKATEEEVNSHWAGLGFYRRARLLHAGAKRVVNEYDGIVPNTVEELMKVEGIGRYTASAVASIAHGVEVPVVDGNVCRVLSRLTGIANHIKSRVLKDDLGWTLADRIIMAKSCSGNDGSEFKSRESIGSPGEVNQALMELGATYCSPAGSGIEDDDPLKEFYVSTQLGVAVGQATCNGDNSTRARVDSLVAKKVFDANENGCRLCDPNGISTAYYNIIDRVSVDLSTDSKADAKTVYAIAGHSSLPIPPPKKSKREEVIAVAVISSQESDNQPRWLMVKRPSEGLLAGQWEFPSVCVWNSAKDGEPKKKGKKPSGKAPVVEIPLIDPSVRSDALDSFLTNLLPSVNFNKREQLKKAPVVHIFSHVCHTMWIEYGVFEADDVQALHSKRYKLENGQEIGWMTEDEMASVGITSGVRKVLAKVQQSKKGAT